MPNSKVKKEGWHDGEGKIEEENGKRGLRYSSSQGTTDTLHMSTSATERPPRSQSNVNLISSGMKEVNNNPNKASSFYSHQRRWGAVMKTGFREL